MKLDNIKLSKWRKHNWDCIKYKQFPRRMDVVFEFTSYLYQTVNQLFVFASLLISSIRIIEEPELHIFTHFIHYSVITGLQIL